MILSSRPRQVKKNHRYLFVYYMKEKADANLLRGWHHYNFTA